MDGQEQKVINEINEGIKAVRDQYAALDGKVKSTEAIQTEQKTLIEKVCKTIDQLEIAYKKAMSFAATGVKEKTAEFKAILEWMRKGTPMPEGIETKVMRISDATTGGYLASPEISNELLKEVIEWSPIREIARVRPTSRESLKIRKRTGTFSAQWTGETGPKTETTGLVYGLEEVPNHELYALVDITNHDLEDSDFDLEAELRSEFSEQFGVAEGAGFVSGNAVGKPQGILTHTGIGNVVSGDANLLTADGFFKLYFAPKTAYVKQARWIMNRATMLAASILKDTTNNYLLRRLGDSPVWAILGAEVVETKDMPNVAAGAFPVTFGDFKRGYTIVDRVSLAILRDPYTQAASGAVRFHARKRVGGQVVQAEAIKKLKIAAS